MVSFKVHDLARRRALITRESARIIGEAVAAERDDQSTELTLDFEGIDAVTPSFLDELLAVTQEALRPSSRRPIRIVFLHTPTRMSAKFAAIAKARDVSIDEMPNGVWSITSPAA